MPLRALLLSSALSCVLLHETLQAQDTEGSLSADQQALSKIESDYESYRANDQLAKELLDSRAISIPGRPDPDTDGDLNWEDPLYRRVKWYGYLEKENAAQFRAAVTSEVANSLRQSEAAGQEEAVYEFTKDYFEATGKCAVAALAGNITGVGTVAAGGYCVKEIGGAFVTPVARLGAYYMVGRSIDKVRFTEEAKQNLGPDYAAKLSELSNQSEQYFRALDRLTPDASELADEGNLEAARTAEFLLELNLADIPVSAVENSLNNGDYGEITPEKTNLIDNFKTFQAKSASYLEAGEAIVNLAGQVGLDLPPEASKGILAAQSALNLAGSLVDLYADASNPLGWANALNSAGSFSALLSGGKPDPSQQRHEEIMSKLGVIEDQLNNVLENQKKLADNQQKILENLNRLSLQISSSEERIVATIVRTGDEVKAAIQQTGQTDRARCLRFAREYMPKIALGNAVVEEANVEAFFNPLSPSLFSALEKKSPIERIEFVLNAGPSGDAGRRDLGPCLELWDAIAVNFAGGSLHTTLGRQTTPSSTEGYFNDTSSMLNNWLGTNYGSKLVPFYFERDGDEGYDGVDGTEQFGAMFVAPRRLSGLNAKSFRPDANTTKRFSDMFRSAGDQPLSNWVQTPINNQNLVATYIFRPLIDPILPYIRKAGAEFNMLDASDEAARYDRERQNRQSLLAGNSIVLAGLAQAAIVDGRALLPKYFETFSNGGIDRVAQAFDLLERYPLHRKNLGLQIVQELWPPDQRRAFELAVGSGDPGLVQNELRARLAKSGAFEGGNNVILNVTCNEIDDNDVSKCRQTSGGRRASGMQLQLVVEAVDGEALSLAPFDLPSRNSVSKGDYIVSSTTLQLYAINEQFSIRLGAKDLLDKVKLFSPPDRANQAIDEIATLFSIRDGWVPVQ